MEKLPSHTGHSAEKPKKIDDFYGIFNRKLDCYKSKET